MGRNPARPDFIGRTINSEGALRQVRISPKGHTEVKTFVVGGALATSLFIPPAYLGVDYDGDTPEWKHLIGFAAVVRVGTVTLTWKRNGSSILTGHVVTTTSGFEDLDTPIPVATGDRIQATITAVGSSPADLSAAFFLTTVPG